MTCAEKTFRRENLSPLAPLRVPLGIGIEGAAVVDFPPFTMSVDRKQAFIQGMVSASV